MAVCLARDSLCAVNHDRPPGRLYARRYSADSCGCLCSRRSSKSSNRTATGRWCFAVNGPTVWSNLGGSGVSDSSLVGFKHTLKTHLFTVEQYVAAVNWCCCDFTAIVAPDTIDFSYLLTRGKRKHGEPHAYCVAVLRHTVTPPLICNVFCNLCKFCYCCFLSVLFLFDFTMNTVVYL